MQDSSRRLQELYRLQAIELYKKLGKENLRDHLLAYWVRQEGLALRPPWILVTGRGSGQNLKATISQMSEKVNKINLESNDFCFCVELPIKAKKAGMQIAEISCHERARIAGKKKVKELMIIFICK